MRKTQAYTDQLGRNIDVPFPPQRIISVVPSQTELLHDLGLDDKVVGITKFCIHPKKWHDEKARIGGTKDLNFEKIKALNPDLIIANKEENDQNQIEKLSKDFPVWISDINDLSSAKEMIRVVSQMCSCSKTGNELTRSIENNFSELNLNLGSSIYLIWNEPLMVAGSDTFISEMLKLAGFENTINGSRYPMLLNSEIQQLNPEFILLSSEPFPFNSEHQRIFQSLFPESKVILVDGEMFSWYGSRLAKAPDYFKQLAKSLK